MKKMILALCALSLPGSAFAGFRADDLAAYYLPDCVAPNHGTTPGPVSPRAATPSDAAPWLADRQWDVRPYQPCPEPVKRKIIRKQVPIKVKPVHRTAPVIPQK